MIEKSLETANQFEKRLTHSLRELGGPCTKSVEVLESCMERVELL